MLRVARQLSTAAAPVAKRPLWLKNVPLKPATAETVAPFGNLFTDFDAEACRVERWPQPAWRPVADGVSGGATEGDFALEWAGRAHRASDAGESAWACAHDALQAAGARASHLDARKVPKLDGDEPGPAACCFAAAEIAYRACGSQLFYSPSAAFVALVAAAPAARAPDGVQPSDFVALLVPPGTGVNLDAFVWHAPPILTGPARTATLRTKQARVRTKIYYDPIVEHGALLRVPLALPESA
jgi:hypothetical protein